MLFQRAIPAGSAASPESLLTGLDLEQHAGSERPYVVCNFVSSADGKATAAARTAQLGGESDRVAFHLLRTQVDAVLAGTGTLRVERYGALVRRPELVEIRRAEGRAAQPLAAIVSAVESGDLGAVAPLGLLLQALARWLHFLGFALSFGVLTFQLLVLRELQPPPRLRRLVYLGIGLLIVAEPIALVAQAASLGTVDSPSLADVLGSAFGRVLALRVGAALLLWGLLGALREVGWRWAWSVPVLGVALALIDGLAGHTIRGAPELAAQLLTAVHVAAMVAWVGGFAALLAVVGATADRQRLLTRFGRLAVVSVALLVASGLLLALVHLRTPADLAFTAYGLTLALKVAAVAAALGAAYLGLRSARSGRPEAIALAGVLALAALLASLPPPR